MSYEHRIMCEQLRHKLSAVERERDELRKLSVTRIILDITPGENGMGHEIHAKSVSEVESLISSLYERLEAEEAEIARRDAAASELIYQMRLLDGEENCSEWVEVTAIEYQTATTDKYGTWERRILYTAAPPAVLPAESGEPDGYIFCHPSGKNFWSVSHPENAGHNGVKPFYFAGPAVRGNEHE